MRISIYTAVKNGIRLDLHIEAMLKHHLALADEIVVNEGYSDDDTYSRICGISDKIAVFRSDWGVPVGESWCVGFKDAARRRCTGDWCIHLDADEFIPEWEFEKLREYLENASCDLVSTHFVNFYANFRVWHSDPRQSRWPYRKMNIHRNRDDIEFWGDGSNVKLSGADFAWDEGSHRFEVHHFGAVRRGARLREKWSDQGRALNGRRPRWWLPKIAFDIFPHRWEDKSYVDLLQIYKGRLIAAVLDDPEEFTRDNMQLLRLLESRESSDSSGEGAR